MNTSERIAEQEFSDTIVQSALNMVDRFQRNDATDRTFDLNVAQNVCTRIGGCNGPSMCNLSIGDGTGYRFIATCNEECAQRARETLGEAAWVGVVERTS